ncbi:MAG: acyl-CoA dehydrogenase [Porticoccaceae bacterium]|nr:acyl-CoA dehydrogenase [Porticoccaceae bacterium]
MSDYVSPWMNEELAIFRDAASRFVEQEMVSRDPEWRRQHHVDKDFWRLAGRQGFLCTDIPASYGGGGGDFRHEAVFFEEQWRRGLSGLGQGVHSITAHYILNHATEEQKQRWLPAMARGDLIGAIAMTEPGTGSDLKAIRTRAVRDGDHYVVNGAKMFITNGYLGELLALVVRTDPDAGARGLSILMLETCDLPGFRVGRMLEKMGQKSQDTCELFFEDVRVPAANLLGGREGQGFAQLMSDLPYERTQVGVQSVAMMEGAIAETLAYVKQRQAFGAPLLELQNTRFRLAEAQATTRVSRVFLDHCIAAVAAGALDNVTAAMCKYWTSERLQQVLDVCLQMHGGYGYMDEYLICRMYADARVARIYAGTSEIMLEVIARGL